VIYRSPYPYFGGKAKVAARIWERLGRPRNYVEPFFGSGAVLLGRPDPEWRGAIETVNDANGYIANFWRALQSDPDTVAYYADWPINENDLHARHWWLINRKESLRARLEGDSDYFDAKVAGWWVWGMAAWIGSGFCDGTGRWYVENGKLIHAGDSGRGVARQLIHAGDSGRGVARKLIHAGNAGQGGGLYDYLYGLAERTKRVRVACGDWSRVCGHSVTTAHGLTGVYLDPPYRFTGRHAELYGEHESISVFDEVMAWAVANGANPLLRIAVSGYGDADVMDTFAAAGWSALRWKAKKGFGGQRQNGNNANRDREVIWFSPHCLPPVAQELPLFSRVEMEAV
jgi:DNA adenine methylase